ncbi:hypothetical protein Zm00014a_027614 [Zea mays]|uniref:Uncharacterized protein n=1 Tax=Zea mays TaxID=4577 RepID=A0A3L6ELS6_MAIZE|nr:hypothetical protein Zm00014a_027614 [Zea mays]
MPLSLATSTSTQRIVICMSSLLVSILVATSALLRQLGRGFILWLLLSSLTVCDALLRLRGMLEYIW